MYFRFEVVRANAGGLAGGTAKRAAVFAALLWAGFAAPNAARGEDTPAAEYARGSQLKTKIDIDAKGQPLGEFLKMLAAEVERKSVRTPKFTYATGIDRAKPVTYTCKGKAVEQVLEEVLKGQGLGYAVVSADGDKYDGFLRIAPASEKSPAATMPAADPAATEDDKLAAARLALAKEMMANGKAAQAKSQLALIAKRYPDTKAGKEAAALLEKQDK